MRCALAALALALAMTPAGCGEADDAAPPGAPAPPPPAAAGSIALTVTTDDGAGATTRGSLECDGTTQRATGDLAGRASAARLCAHAREISKLLTTQPPARACTQIYGGPETAHVTGTIDGATVDRRFSRTNGCEIADYQEAAGLLAP